MHVVNFPILAITILHYVYFIRWKRYKQKSCIDGWFHRGVLEISGPGRFAMFFVKYNLLRGGVVWQMWSEPYLAGGGCMLCATDVTSNTKKKFTNPSRDREKNVLEVSDRIESRNSFSFPKCRVHAKGVSPQKVALTRVWINESAWLPNLNVIVRFLDKSNLLINDILWDGRSKQNLSERQCMLSRET